MAAAHVFFFFLTLQQLAGDDGSEESDAASSFIGVLDIFGFECMPENGYVI